MSTIKSSAENLTLNADGANNDIKFQSNGSEVASIDQAGSLVLSGNLTSVGIDDNADATAITIDSSERVGIGTTSPQNPLEVSGNTNYLMRITQTGTNKHMFKTVGNGASMDFLADGANNYVGFNSTTSGDDIRFQTNDGNERVRILAAGGLTFNGDTAAANALDDYEEGTWIPTLTGSTSGSFTTTAYRHLAYTKIGRVVHIQGYINVGSESSCSGSINMSLPFTASSSLDGDSENASINVMLREFSGSNLFNVAGSIAGANMRFVAVSGAGGDIILDSGDVDAVWNFRVGGSYIAA